MECSKRRMLMVTESLALICWMGHFGVFRLLLLDVNYILASILLDSHHSQMNRELHTN